jgi:hypothetical protein
MRPMGFSKHTEWHSVITLQEREVFRHHHKMAPTARSDRICVCCRFLSAVYTVAAAEGIRAALAPTAEYFATLNLPSALVRWGHPGALQLELAADNPCRYAHFLL